MRHGHEQGTGEGAPACDSLQTRVGSCQHPDAPANTQLTRIPYEKPPLHSVFALFSSSSSPQVTSSNFIIVHAQPDCPREPLLFTTGAPYRVPAFFIKSLVCHFQSVAARAVSFVVFVRRFGEKPPFVLVSSVPTTFRQAISSIPSTC